MHTITKRLQFCYGHRLLEYEGKCAHPHGHNALVEVEVSSECLDSIGMVCDFGEIKRRLLGFIEAELDHRMILRADDPLARALESVGERPYLLDGNPTAENLAKLLFEKALELDLPVASVRFWETDSSCAEYRGGSVSHSGT